MNSEERSQVSEVLRCRLQAWKVWRRGIKVLPRRRKENRSTVHQEQAPRIQGLALQHVAQRIASLVLQDQNSWLWRQVESNNFTFHLEQRNQFWLSKYTDILWTIERPWDNIVGTWEPYLFPQTWNNRGWRPSPLLGPGHINCSGIAHLLNFQFIASGRYNHAMKARKKRVPCEPVCDQYGQCWNALTGELLTPGHLARTLAETNPGSTILRGGGGDAHTLELSNGLLLHPLQCFSRRDSMEGGGAQASVVDEGGGRFHIIDIEGMNVSTQQQKSEQASAAAARTTNLTEPKLEPSVGTPKRQADVRHSREQSKSISDGPFSNEELLYPLCGGGDASAAGMLVIDDDGVLVQNIVSTIFGGLVILPLTNLTGTSKGDYPEFIRLGLYVGYVLLVVLTFLGLTAKKMAKPAMRVAAGMSIVAVTISAVYEVSEKVYIKGIIGILGAMGTLATALIKWR